MKDTSSAFCEKLRQLERGKRNTRADAMLCDLAGRCADEIERLASSEKMAWERVAEAERILGDYAHRENMEAITNG